jgi:hypothetical protein
LLEIEAQNSEDARAAAAAQERQARRHSGVVVVLGLMGVSIVLLWTLWPVTPATLAGGARRRTAFLGPITAPLGPSKQQSKAPLSPPQVSEVGLFQPRTKLLTPLKSSPITFFQGPDWGKDPSLWKMHPGDGQIKTFLTQRAFQNLIELLHVERNMVTADWLENWIQRGWYGNANLKNFHGLAALIWEPKFALGAQDLVFAGGRSYIAQLLRSPTSEITVDFKRHGAAGNPFLQDHVHKFKEKIEPSKLASRVIQLRAAIAEEWIEDLELITKENEEIWRSFFEKVRENGEDKLKDLQMPIFDHDPSDEGNQGQTLLRGGNYDLLKRLSTMEATMAVRDEYQRTGQQGNHEDWVKSVFIDWMLINHGDGFSGNAGYDVDKQFLEALLNRPPSVIDTIPPILISPMQIADQICGARQQIAQAWIEELKSVPQDNREIQEQFLHASLPAVAVQ